MVLQLDLFPPPYPAWLKRIDPTTLATEIGSDQQWQARTLSDILCLWDSLYNNYIDAADQQINQTNQHLSLETDHRKRKRWKIELEHLRKLRMDSYCILYSLYVERMRTVVDQVEAAVRLQTSCEDIIAGVDEFVSEVFLRPGAADLSLTIADLTTQLIAELLE